jgi:hypothetical protein
VLNKLLHFLPWEFDYLSLIPCSTKKVFLMLSQEYEFWLFEILHNSLFGIKIIKLFLLNTIEN